MIEKMLIATIAGLFGLVPVLMQWLSARRKSKTYGHKLSALSSELEFLERLIGLSGEVTEKDTKQVLDGMASHFQTELERIFANYKSLQITETESKPAHTEVSLLRRSFLLFQPISRKGWMIHSTFYVLVIFAVSIILSDIQSPTFDPETGENEFTDLLVGMVAIFGPIFIYIQRAAMRNYKSCENQ